jgi:hypothetical protein
VAGGSVSQFVRRTTQGRHFTRAFCIDGGSSGGSQIKKDTEGKAKIISVEVRFARDSPLEEEGFELPVRGRGKSGYRPFCAAQAPERLALRPGSRRCLRPAPAIVFTRGQTMRCTAPKRRIVPAMILPRTDEPMQR